jgi:hypothetical protein
MSLGFDFPASWLNSSSTAFSKICSLSSTNKVPNLPMKQAFSSSSLKIEKLSLMTGNKMHLLQYLKNGDGF